MTTHEHELRLDGPYPVQPPELIPWNGFDPEGDDRIAEACRTLARKLADDEWHGRAHVIAFVSKASGLNWATTFKLLKSIEDHGDIRIKAKSVRLTTRFRP